MRRDGWTGLGRYCRGCKEGLISGVRERTSSGNGLRDIASNCRLAVKVGTEKEEKGRERATVVRSAE